MTKEELVSVLSYNPCTGQFLWKGGRKGRKGAGKEAGTTSPRGYRQICVDYKIYLAHRLAWLYTYGKWPEEVDHLDNNPCNNSVFNLSDGSHSDNMLNQRRFK